MTNIIDLETCKVRPQYSRYIQQYYVDNLNSTPRGVVRVDVKDLLREFGQFYDFFTKEGLAENDKIGFIYHFWPNGLPENDMGENPKLEPLMRKGIGSEVLNFVIDDLISKFDSKVCYFDGERTNPIYMVDFLLNKHEFSKIILDEGLQYLYKIY